MSSLTDQQSQKQENSAQETRTSLAWLADAPLFIDKEQVTSFYDAVVRPEGQQGTTVISLERFRGQTTKGEGTVEGEMSLSKFITTLLPFLDIKGKTSVGISHERTGSETQGETIELHPIDTPQRQLVQLTLHYLTNLPGRIKVENDPTRPGWYNEAFISQIPRALVFLDFPAGTMFVPMAAEVEKGRIVTIFDKLDSKGEKPPVYPERNSFDAKEEYGAAWKEYWNWFKENFSDRLAMEAVEKVIAEGGGRVQWIDYRIPLPEQWPLHLHVCGRGQYDTGTFAYNLIKRGFNHGLRIVGTLKSEPDLNVLAIFEK